MKRITIGFVSSLLLLLPLMGSGASVAPNNDVAKPYYNGGYTFGLASYSSGIPGDDDDDISIDFESIDNQDNPIL